MVPGRLTIIIDEQEMFQGERVEQLDTEVRRCVNSRIPFTRMKVEVALYDRGIEGVNVKVVNKMVNG